jgi:hypothetical protein
MRRPELIISCMLLILAFAGAKWLFRLAWGE